MGSNFVLSVSVPSGGSEALSSAAAFGHHHRTKVSNSTSVNPTATAGSRRVNVSASRPDHCVLVFGRIYAVCDRLDLASSFHRRQSQPDCGT